MKKIWFFVPVALLLLLSLSVIPALAGFEGYWNSESIADSSGVINEGGQTARTYQVVFFKNGKMSIHVKNKPELMVIRPDLNLLWRIDKKNATYREIGFEDIKTGINMAESIMESEEMKNIMETLEGMPQAQHEMLEKMRSKSGPARELKMVSTGKKETVLGEESEVVELCMGDETVMTLWLAKKYDLGHEYYRHYETLGMFPGASYEELKKLRGLPIKSIIKLGNDNIKTTVITIVTKIIETKINDKKFELPDGLVKKN